MLNVLGLPALVRAGDMSIAELVSTIRRRTTQGLPVITLSVRETCKCISVAHRFIVDPHSDYYIVPADWSTLPMYPPALTHPLLPTEVMTWAMVVVYSYDTYDTGLLPLVQLVPILIDVADHISDRPHQTPRDQLRRLAKRMFKLGCKPCSCAS